MASQYKGWPLEYIGSLPPKTINVLLKRISERQKLEYRINAYSMYLSISAVMSKDGKKAFESFMDELDLEVEQNSQVEVNPVNLMSMGFADKSSKG